MEKEIKVKVDGIIAVPEGLQELSDHVKEAYKIGLSTQQIKKHAIQTLQAKAMLEDGYDKIKAQMAVFEKQYKAYKDMIGDIEGTIKQIAIEDAENHKSIKRKIDHNTGEVIDVVEVKLPKGFSYRKGTTSFNYKEELIPDKFFKKTLKKTEAKKALESGELSYDVVDIIEGQPSINLLLSSMIKEDEE